MARTFSTLNGMDAQMRTRMFLMAATVILLSVLLLLPGCAPHRRGRPPASDSVPDPVTASPARDRIVTPPAQDSPSTSTPRQDIDRTQHPSDQVCDMALSFTGVPYVYGGTTPKGFDCSGLVQYVYREVGVALPRTARDQARTGRAATLRTMLRGDLIFFRINRDVISHVGIYVGKGRFVHAPGTGKKIRTDSIDNGWWRQRVKAVRRVIAS
jgi:cell wall-associated NlpC family hydrolase